VNPSDLLSCNEFRVWQDGTERSAAGLRDDAIRIEAALGAGIPIRAALASSRADHVVASLTACQARGCELLLLRDSMPVEPTTLAQWGVSALIDESLRLTWMDAPPVEVEGFRVLMTTSGTTGAPKVAKHRVERLTGRIRPAKAGSGTARWLLTYHPASFAGLQVLLTAIGLGGDLICMARPTIASLAEAALATRPTHISGTPTFWRGFLLALGERAAEIPLVQATLGGEAVDQSILNRLRARFPYAGLTHIYASTEAGALFAVRDGQAGFPASWLEHEVDGIELRVRHGQLEVRSPRAMDGYVAASVDTPLTQDGWLRTGDSVEIGGNRVIFLGRADSTINVGGAKVLPEEVEAVLLELPAVADVRVYAVKNPITGELVAAEVVLQQGSEPASARAAILAHARSRLAEYKVPRILRYTGQIAASEAGKKNRV